MKPYSYLLVPVLAGSCLFGVPAAQAEEAPAPTALPAAASQAPENPEQEQIYGYELMTPEERVEHMNRMQAAKTLEERQKIRDEHHKLMQERAVEQGVSLPDMPGPGPGAGMGPGKGMGPGGNK